MRSYLILFSLSFFLTLGLTPLVRRWALRCGAVDLPDGGRRIHVRPTPRLGGMAIYLAFLATLGVAPWLGTLVSQNLLNNWQDVGVVLLVGTLIFALGIYDDFHGARAAIKVTVQALAATLLYAYGFRISGLSSPFGGWWELSALLSFPLTVLWIVGITNAFNLIDGIDGLASGASAFALLSLFLCSLAQEHPEVSLISIILVGAVLGFLRYNFNPATIFLGDSGSLLLGFMAAVLSLVGAQKSPTLIAIAIPLISFGLPVVEVGISLSRRFVSGAPLFEGDRRHIHHMLLKRGLTQRQVVILLYVICALFTLFGLMLLNPQRNKVALILFVLGVGVVLGVYQLRYTEFDALGLRLRRGVGRRKRSLAASARWLGSIESLRGASNLEELQVLLTELCETHGLTAARLELESVRAARAIADESWSWPNDESFNRQSALFDRCWSLRLPLIGIDGQPLGVFTLYQSFDRATNDALPLDLAQTAELLSRELSTQLVEILSQSPQAIENYVPNFKGDSVPAVR
ncbi:MAG TPA: MraY family glycosyltransferase [Blastocatellia bacterium]|nr:MraY family glycosyltransferase [Blastocatellia bacterium]HMV85701.1 MraY family glycosyltransferase [Blastocatellia bacterium]HMX24201.1 MraY family glycosyltransferase [Blastocatellia bacterium]HMY72182.1 MraY family glycosyltransferase [Blastocatellia bacterium]HMZ16424.1 MraY family glycosyltransferase [Blastocatellia bacterium]